MGSCSVAEFLPFDRGDGLLRFDFTFWPFGKGGTRITSPVHFVADGSTARSGLLNAGVPGVWGVDRAPFAAESSPSRFLALPTDLGASPATVAPFCPCAFGSTRDPTATSRDDAVAEAGRFEGDFAASAFAVAGFDPDDFAAADFATAGFAMAAFESAVFERAEFFGALAAETAGARPLSLRARRRDDFGRSAVFRFLARAIRPFFSITYCPAMGNNIQNAVLYVPPQTLSSYRHGPTRSLKSSGTGCNRVPLVARPPVVRSTGSVGWHVRP